MYNNVEMMMLLCRQLQIMHWNSDMYRSVQDALVGDEGIAALAVFMDVRELEVSLTPSC